MSDAGGPNGYQKLPPGWDCKYDQTTGNCYYINYLTKAMQLEDPRAGRSSYKQLQNERCSTESIALQPLTQHSHHSSPFHVVHPSNNLTAVRAFQERALHNLSTSPLLSASSRGQLELSSPLPLQRARLPSNMSRRSTIQETSFSDTQAVVTKIQNMFPTADENHIRLLLKRYYNREAVVISALQVEKHPVTMPGPFVTPPAQRHLFHSNSAFYMTPPARRLDMGASRVTVTSRTASPLPGGRFGSLMSMQSGHQQTGAATAAGAGVGVGVGVVAMGLHGSPQWRSSPKPHSSPKMKLRYMKNIFPKADEMLLLDILANADNNVQFASEKLISLGYVKRDMQQPHKPNNRPPQLESEQQDQAVQHIPLRPKEYTAEQKAEMESLLKQKYPHIAERIILMALESVNYAEDRATQILQIVQDEDEQRSQKQTLSTSQPAAAEMKLKVDQVDALHRQRQLSSQLDNGQHLESGEFQSLIERMATLGANAQLAKGADEHLLLADYVTWNGPNTTLCQKQTPQGPDAGLIGGERGYKAVGRNAELCKGAKKELSKGSIYARSKGANIKCN
ncbi:uncharacterized protein LOC111594360 isoform X3 [Drosophila hydei]|uniref:Uncharacterized protein LOC111594360 isoform X3 n=1 Tax=Drosophila hydei TaxID=7224 RepID=A0A6J1L9N9_DROHY|nr:uncharacterized protein LOC111594360 isoform X3 [Drosophila hydei]